MEHHQEDRDTENWERLFALFSDLAAACYGFDRILAMEETALTRIYDRTAGEAGPGDDPLKWAGSLYRGLASEWRRTVFTYPAGPRRIPAFSGSGAAGSCW